MNKSLKKSLSYVVRGGVATSAMDTLAVGATLTAYAKLLGAGNITFGLLGAVPYIGNLIHLWAAALMTRGHSAKKLSIISALLSRPFYLFVALLAFWPHATGTLGLLVLFLMCSYLIGCISGGCWLPWMKVLVPEKVMGRFFAYRFRCMQIVKVICSLGAAGLLHFVKSTYPDLEIYTYSFLFLVACLIGLYGAYTFFQVEDRPLNIRPDIPFFKQVANTFTNRPFRALLMCCSLINFGFLFITPFVTVFMLNRLNYSGADILIFTLISQLAFVFVVKKLGRIGDKLGSERILTIALYWTILILAGLIGLNYVSCSGWILWLLVGVINVMLGFATAGYNLGLNNTSLLYVPKETATVYLSVNSVFKSLAGAMGSVAGGLALAVCTALTQYLPWSSTDTTAWTLFFLVACLIVVGGIIMTNYLKRYKHA